MLRHILAVFSVVFWVALVGVAHAQSAPETGSQASGEIGHVIVDGRHLFSVRGTQSFPAQERANGIADAIETAAENGDPSQIELLVEEKKLGYSIQINGAPVAFLIPEDAELEFVDLPLLAQVQGVAIQEAIAKYRRARTSDARMESLSRMAGWTVLFAAAMYILLLLRRKVPKFVRRMTEKRLKQIQAATSKIIRGRAISAFISVMVRLFFLVLILVTVYYYVSFVLFSFVETRPIARILITYISDPIFDLMRSIIGYIPNFVTLLVIFFTTRYLLKMLRNVFDNIESGTLSFEGFEAHWIWPTFNILRGLLVIFALILGYPYIPGSSSQAFQAVSILLGLMVSMGSNSVVSNAMAGLFVLYRRSANIGDRIKVGEHTGDVVAIKLMETYIKSLKNELISVPNAQMLNSEVINYSTKIDGRGLMVHTTVGIGYDEPQEKVEALLLEAVARTTYVKKTPAPFVLRMGLGDFAVNYQVNGFTTRGEYMQKILSELHGHILDVFAENGVQIMSPHYEGDPETPKIPPVTKKASKEDKA